MLTAIPDNFIYFGLFLTDKSKEELMKVANKIAPKQMAEATNVYLEHITLLHKNDKHSDTIQLRMYDLLNHMFESFIGETYKVAVTDIGFNQKAIAFKVELPNGFPMFLFKTYHIIIATFHRARPVESNNIIDWHPLYEPIGVTTILKKVIKDENI